MVQQCVSMLQEDQLSKMIYMYQIQNWASAKKINAKIKDIIENSGGLGSTERQSIIEDEDNYYHLTEIDNQPQGCANAKLQAEFPNI